MLFNLSVFPAIKSSESVFILLKRLIKLLIPFQDLPPTYKSLGLSNLVIAILNQLLFKREGYFMQTFLDQKVCYDTMTTENFANHLNMNP